MIQIYFFKHMRIKVLILLLAFVAMNFSCQNDSVEKSNDSQTGSIIDNNPDQDGITEIDSIVEATPNAELVDACDIERVTKKNSEEGGTSGTIIPMKIVAHVAPPEVNNVTVQATCVSYNQASQVAYVSYNTQNLDESNAIYKGAIQAIDLSNPKEPRLLTSVKTIGYEFSALSVDATNGFLFAVGAADVDLIKINGVALSHSAIMVRYRLDSDGSIVNETPTCIPLTSYVAKDVKVNNGKVFVVSGDAGAAFVYEASSLDRLGYYSLKDLRSFAISEGEAYVLSGDNADAQGYIHHFNQGTFDEIVSGVKMDNGNFAGAQRIMDSYRNYLLVPQGEYGLSVYRKTGGSSVNDIPIYELSEAGKIVAMNTVRYVSYKDHDYLLLAEGEAGLCVRAITDNDITKATSDRGRVDLNGSANYAYVGENEVDGDFIFVASGSDGVNILQLFNDENLVESTYCSDNFPNAPFEDYDSWDGDKNVIQNGSSSDVYYFYSASENMNFDKNIAVTLIWSGNFCLSTTVQNNGTLLVCGGTLYCNWVNLNSGQVIVDGNVEGYNGINFNSGASMSIEGNGRNMSVKESLTLNSGSNLYVEGNDMILSVNTLNVQGGKIIVNGNNCTIDVSGAFNSNGGEIIFNGTGNTINAQSEGNGNTKITGDWSTTSLKKPYK